MRCRQAAVSDVHAYKKKCSWVLIKRNVPAFTRCIMTSNTARVWTDFMVYLWQRLPDLQKILVTYSIRKTLYHCQRFLESVSLVLAATQLLRG